MCKFWRNIKNKKEETEHIEIDECKLENIIEWFKQDKFIKYTKDKKNILVLIKGDNSVSGLNELKKKYKGNYLIQAFYDKEKESILFNRVIFFKTLSEDLLKQFGDKDMLIIN